MEQTVVEGPGDEGSRPVVPFLYLNICEQFSGFNFCTDSYV